MTRGDQIRTAIQRHGTATLGDEARRQEDRTLLALLAHLVDQRPEPDAHDSSATAAGRLKPCPTGGSIALHQSQSGAPTGLPEQPAHTWQANQRSAMVGQVNGAAASGRGKRKAKCPCCGHEEYTLSHRRNLLERAVSTVGIRPVRCLRCNQRRLAFVGFGWFSQPKSSSPARKES